MQEKTVGKYEIILMRCNPCPYWEQRLLKQIQPPSALLMLLLVRGIFSVQSTQGSYLLSQAFMVAKAPHRHQLILQNLCHPVKPLWEPLPSVPSSYAKKGCEKAHSSQVPTWNSLWAFREQPDTLSTLSLLPALEPIGIWGMSAGLFCSTPF